MLLTIAIVFAILTAMWFLYHKKHTMVGLAVMQA